jgi:23S rRNA A1618 N6-methylase RlmF
MSKQLTNEILSKARKSSLAQIPNDIKRKKMHLERHINATMCNPPLSDSLYELIHKPINQRLQLSQEQILQCIGNELSHLAMLGQISLAHDLMRFVGEVPTIVEGALDEGLVTFVTAVDIFPR